VVGKRFSVSELPGYIIALVLGVIAASSLLYLIVSGKAGFQGVGGFASNSYGANSSGGFSMMSVLLTEVAMTAIFLIVILGATAKNAAAGFGGLAVGLSLTLIHWVSISVSNTSVNPARSTGPALFAQTGAMGDLWLLCVAPIVGAVLDALIYNVLLADKS
jgi:aquaporin Z